MGRRSWRRKSQWWWPRWGAWLATHVELKLQSSIPWICQLHWFFLPLFFTSLTLKGPTISTLSFTNQCSLWIQQPFTPHSITPMTPLLLLYITSSIKQNGIPLPSLSLYSSLQVQDYNNNNMYQNPLGICKAINDWRRPPKNPKKKQEKTFKKISTHSYIHYVHVY